MRNASFIPLLSVALLAACQGDEHDHNHDGADAGGDHGADVDNDALPTEAPETYAFESRFVAGTSSVAYDGQTFRHLLIEALKADVGSLTARIDSAAFLPDEDGEVVATLDYWFRFDSSLGGTEEIPVVSALPILQAILDDVSSGKDLVGKVAGNDASTDFINFSTGFRGVDDATLTEFGGSLESAEGLVIGIFETLEENAIQRAAGTFRTGPGDVDLPVYVTEAGVDLQQLLQKLLTVSITFHQGLDDYLDDDIDGKGILSTNDVAVEGEAYTALEHAWDEGFGYFGAAQDYGFYTVEELAGAGGRDDWNGQHDSNGDGSIDLSSEYTFGLSSNAAKRDNTSLSGTTMAHDTFEAFVAGRALIANAGGNLSEAQLAELREYRDAVAAGWELAIAATVIHYINGVLAVMAAAEADPTTYDFFAHAKKWSEMKGFALGFQFHRNSPILPDFDELHALLRSAPVLPSAGAEASAAYRADLIAARALLAEAFDVDPADVGDNNGANGW